MDIITSLRVSRCIHPLYMLEIRLTKYAIKHANMATEVCKKGSQKIN